MSPCMEYTAHLGLVVQGTPLAYFFNCPHRTGEFGWCQQCRLEFWNQRHDNYLFWPPPPQKPG